MADKQEFEIDGKQLSLLRVVDLKQELEKRGLSKSGSKKELQDRLKMHLQLENLQQTAASQDEGQVPNLRLQDDAIAEQSDVIKEYLAKQQQTFQMQKEARRQVEMEEEMKRHSSESKTLEHATSDVTESPPVVSAKEEVRVLRSDHSLEQEQEVNSSTTDLSEVEMKKEIQDEIQSQAVQNQSDVSESSDKIINLKRDEIEPMQEDVVSKPREPDEDANNVASQGSAVQESTLAEEIKSKANADVAEEEKNVGEKMDTGVSDISKESPKISPPISPTNANEHNLSGETEKVEEVKVSRPRIKREFFNKEVSRDVTEAPNVIATPDSATPDRVAAASADDYQPKEAPPEKKSEVILDSIAEENVVDSSTPVMRKRLKRRTSSQPDLEEVPKVREDSRSRSNSSESSSSIARDKKRRKSFDDASNSSRSSSEESRKSQNSQQHESDSVSSSEAVQKIPSESKKFYDISSSQNKLSEGEKEAPVQVEKAIKEMTPEDDDKDMMEVNLPVDVQLGDNNEEFMDTGTAAENEDHNQQKGLDKESGSTSDGRVHVRKISLSSSKDISNKENIESAGDGDKPPRKRKWGSTATKGMKKTSFTISTDSLKTLIPDVKRIPNSVSTDMPLDIVESPPSDHEETMSSKDVKIYRTVAQIVQDNGDSETMDVSQPKVEEIHQFHRPLSLVEEPLERPHSPSPARNAPSCIVHIRNLVRPFTLNQLKDILSRTGTLTDGGFWIDKIKSKCYATYATVEEAIATRHALHGTQWPPSNRKNLICDFADDDELRFHLSLEFPVEPPKQEKYPEPPPREINRRIQELAMPHTARMRDLHPAPIPPPIREWDRDKIGERSPGDKDRNKRIGSPMREKRRERSRENKERKEKRDKRKEEEEAPAKLLDDLFKKTKMTPCIYWLPLTTEQIKLRDEEKKQRDIEREKRRQQIKKETETEKGKTNVARDVKKIKTEEPVHHRKRSSPPSHSRNRKR